MARMAVNLVIEKRKTMENGGRTYSAISVMIHVVLALAIVLTAVYARHREALKPKVYRVSIATLPSTANSNMNNRNTVKKVAPETQPAEQPAPEKAEPKPVKKTARKPAKPKEAVGIDTSRKTETEPDKPEPAPLEDLPGSGSDRPSTPATSGGADNRVGFGNQGSIFDVDGANFEYSYYLGLIQNRIGSNWVRSYIGRGKVKVYFRIARSGKIVSAIIEQSSGDAGLDRLALHAVTASDPLPPLPEGYGGDVLGIHIWFNYEE